MTVLITGACGGLGRAMAAECARRGYELFMTDIDECALDILARGMRRLYGVKAAYRACNLTDPASVKLFFEYIDSFGLKFNMLLNIAGVDFEGGFAEIDSELLADIVRLNIEATIRMTHGALKRRRQDSSFNIVIVSSLASMYPMPLKATYAASKRFLLDFSIALRQELRRENGSVLALCPAGLATTAKAIEGIMAQGFWGAITTASLEHVARKTIDRSLRGRPMYIPGAVNCILGFLGRIMPKTLLAKILYARWSGARNRRLPYSA